MSDAVPPPGSWTPATKFRRLLAVYLDYLIFGAAWALVLWAGPVAFFKNTRHC